jgi:hypothetical protein
VLDYVGQVNGIPPEKVSEIKALIEEGKIDEANAMLDEASRTRDAAIEAQALTDQAEQDLEYLARDRNARINAQVLASGGTGYGGEGAVRARAAGGPVSAGKPYLVGEEGPELMVPGSSGTVIPNSKLTAGSTAAATGGNTYNVTLNVAPGSNTAEAGRVFVEAIQDYERVNSSRWRAS